MPVTFLSGKIHKLQLHVPWTRLIYEPVIVTIKTMEFIIKLNDSSTTEESTDSTKVEIDIEDSSPTIDPAVTGSEDLPPGYVQGLLNKVVNNICFKVENIIIKYVEDDIVFSLNVKSVDCFCVDSKWERSFIDLSLPDLVLRRMCTITDFTVCLDQRTTSGKIDLYQDPVLYKCNLTSRIVTRYRSVNSTKPFERNIDIACDSFDFSLTDLQIPMVLRLLKLVIGLFYGTLDLPGCSYKKHTGPSVLEKQRNASCKNLNVLSESKADLHNDSWSSWAWSMIGTNTEEQVERVAEDTVTSLGIFINQVTLTLKKTTHLPNMLSGQRFEFTPIIGVELGSCNVKFTSIGDLVINVSVGFTSFTGYLFGKNCMCGTDGSKASFKVSEDNEDANLEVK